MEKVISFLESLIKDRETIEKFNSSTGYFYKYDGQDLNLHEGLCLTLDRMGLPKEQVIHTKILMLEWPEKAFQTIAFIVPASIGDSCRSKADLIYFDYLGNNKNMYGLCPYGQARWALIEWLLGELKK